MKKLLLIISLVFLVEGCAPGRIINTRLPSINEVKTASVGDVFFIMEDITILPASGGSAFDLMSGKQTMSTDSFRFDLVILELTDQKVGLQYSEYFVPMKLNPLSYGKPDSWLIKQGFSKRFDYVVADKIISFRGYEFEIVGIEKGQIKYKRIK